MSKKSSLQKWAKKEVELACKKEAPDRKDGEFDYGCACYESALKAFDSLCKDGPSGFSIKMTKYILDRLIDGLPLTAIEDTDDTWNCVLDHGGRKSYQCARMSSLFKDVYPNGDVKYTDNQYCYCVDVKNPHNTYSLKLVKDIILGMYPITMPYMPTNEPIMVYCSECLTDPNNGDMDTIGVLYAIKPDGERVDIYRYFKEGPGNEYSGWVEIDEHEYQERYKLNKIR